MARRKSARRGWFGALLGLGVLAAASFLVGALAGFVWKEPGLLVAYLRGETTEVAWSTASAGIEPAELPQVAAAPEPEAEAAPETSEPPVSETPRQVAPERARKLAAAPPQPAPPKRPPPAAAAPKASIAVQVGAFSERAAADRLRGRLDQAGFPAYLSPGAVSGQPWRVRVGPYATRVEADQIASRLKRDQKLPTWVLDEDSARP
jgi:cell division septation protein DedD